MLGGRQLLAERNVRGHLPGAFGVLADVPNYGRFGIAFGFLAAPDALISRLLNAFKAAAIFGPIICPVLKQLGRRFLPGTHILNRKLNGIFGNCVLFAHSCFSMSGLIAAAASETLPMC